VKNYAGGNNKGGGEDGKIKVQTTWKSGEKEHKLRKKKTKAVIAVGANT